MRRIRNRVIVWINYKGALRLGLGALIVFLVSFMLTQETPTSRTWTYWTLSLSGKTIYLDAGHGGADGGAVSKQGDVEKDLNLAIALHLRDYLQQAGAVVLMTREDDRDLAEEGTKAISRRKTEDLLRRVDNIRRESPDLVVSIHMNSIPSPRWSGAQTFYYPNHPDNQLLASLIQEEIKRNLENTNRVANPVNTVYLLKAIETIPTALVEVGFLSNPGEARRLADTDYQRQVAASIYQGILRYSAGEKGVPGLNVS
ncbi:N-acetylmuramoyl-L-alanine amidase [Paenibacillus darwinianus]|uniref:N-acetylmuramoyl-L-alanine amidase n=1 Tax=Paenibacillus darwinianus TaxID=1380763 RepID=A0A9W5S239_9BACL|nr:N-acetylmuramoyl-L-alanine amidase CwlD [Paenibacillus darwinianus]EXX89611.1 N-acetylmuramoyl-L-alanine amidase [Paenibacillus darwinianus]EXX90303.1 N-acetylmuramoyl-L-alanine amidase [Paenibacillus darwinianus]